MRSVWALVRVSWLSAASYRMNLLFALGGLAVAFVPVYFVADALQPVVAESIADEGGQYFGFLVIGLVAIGYVSTSLSSLPGRVQGAIGNGTLEALLTTPLSLPALVLGFTTYELMWMTARSAVLIGAGWLLGMPVAWQGLPLALVPLLLTVTAYLGLGMMATSLVLSWRTSGPFVAIVVAASSLLGGVYYSTSVIPSWLNDLSQLVPLTFGLRAMRRLVLEGPAIGAVWVDVTVTGLFALVLMGLGALSLQAALRYGRRTGTLGQY